VLEVLHEDGVDGSRYIHFLHTAPSASAELCDGSARTLTGSWVKARGVRKGQVLALGSGKTNVKTVTEAVPNTFGAQQTLVMLVNFEDAPTEPFTPDQCGQRSSTTTSNSGWRTPTSRRHSRATGGLVYIAYTNGVRLFFDCESGRRGGGRRWVTTSLHTRTTCMYFNQQLLSVGRPINSWWKPVPGVVNGTIDLAFTSTSWARPRPLPFARARLDCGTATIGTTMSSTYPPPPGTCT
jgi:hypothetical protein